MGWVGRSQTQREVSMFVLDIVLLSIEISVRKATLGIYVTIKLHSSVNSEHQGNHYTL